MENISGFRSTFACATMSLAVSVSLCFAQGDRNAPQEPQRVQPFACDSLDPRVCLDVYQRRMEQQPERKPEQELLAPAASGVGGVTSPCTAELAKLRDDVQKSGLAAKAAGQRKASREEMCKHITAYSAAELKWVKYTKEHITSCAIRTELLAQLEQVHSNTEQIKEKICAREFGQQMVGKPWLDPWIDLPSSGTRMR
jgi:hypothetical protein